MHIILVGVTHTDASVLKAESGIALLIRILRSKGTGFGRCIVQVVLKIMRQVLVKHFLRFR